MVVYRVKAHALVLENVLATRATLGICVMIVLMAIMKI